MAYIPQTADYDLLKQSERRISVRVEVTDKNNSTLARISGNLISDSYAIDATSDIRRTASLVFAVTDSRFLINEDSLIWFAHYMHVELGAYSFKKRDFLWYDMGTYLWDQASNNYNAVTNTISLNCLDLMAQFTESYGNPLSGSATKIPAGSDIRNAMISLLSETAGITNYRIEQMNGTVPYDMEYACGAYPYRAIKELRDLYVGWETFFDGTEFICQPYPTYDSDPIVLTADVIAPLIQTENTITNFAAVKNVSEVWGAFNDDTEEQFSAINKLVSKDPSTILVVHNGVTMSLLERDKLDEPTDNITYTIDPSNPFALDKIGERRQVLSGGNFDAIYTQDLARQRAEYETWRASDMLNTITLTMLEIPWLDVNQKIEYTSQSTGETKTYLIKRKSGSSMSGIMTLECVVFKPTYIWNN